MSTAALAEVGLKAVTYQQAAAARRNAKIAFNEACCAWKEDQGHGRLERGTPAWEALIAAVAGEIATLQRAKAAERSARDRMFRACRKVSA